MTSRSSSLASPDADEQDLRLGRAVMLRLDALAAITETSGMLTRRYLTPAHVAAMRQVQAWMGEAGLATRVDALGTVIGR